MMTTHTYRLPEGARHAGAPPALIDDVKRGKVSVGDVVVFGWEDGRRNLVKTAFVDENEHVNLWLFEIVDESVVP